MAVLRRSAELQQIKVAGMRREKASALHLLSIQRSHRNQGIRTFDNLCIISFPRATNDIILITIRTPSWSIIRRSLSRLLCFLNLSRYFIACHANLQFKDAIARR